MPLAFFKGETPVTPFKSVDITGDENGCGYLTTRNIVLATITISHFWKSENYSVSIAYCTIIWSSNSEGKITNKSIVLWINLIIDWYWGHESS